MVHRLGEDHQNAKRLAEGTFQIPGLEIDMASVQTNMVAVGIKETGMDEFGFAAFLKSIGVLVNPSLPLRSEDGYPP